MAELSAQIDRQRAEQGERDRHIAARRAQIEPPSAKPRHRPHGCCRNRPVRIVGSTCPAFASIQHAADCLDLRAGTIREALRCGYTVGGGEFRFEYAEGVGGK